MVKTGQFTTKYKGTHTHTRLTANFPVLPRWASTRKVTPIWILLKQETVSGSSISWAICQRRRNVLKSDTAHSVSRRHCLVT